MNRHWERRDGPYPYSEEPRRRNSGRPEWIRRPNETLRQRADMQRASRNNETTEGLHWLDYYEKLFAYQGDRTIIGNRVIERLETLGIYNVGDYLSHKISGQKGDNWSHIFETFISSYDTELCFIEEREKMEDIFHLGLIHHSLLKVRKIRDKALSEERKNATVANRNRIDGRSNPN